MAGLTSKQTLKIADRLRKGERIRKLGEEFGVSRQRVHQICKEYGINYSRVDPVVHNREEMRHYQRWYNMRLTDIPICKSWDDLRVFISWCKKACPVAGWYFISDGVEYSPAHCRFVTPAVGQRLKARKYEAFGKAKTLMEWTEDSRCSINQRTLRARIKSHRWPLSLIHI